MVRVAVLALVSVLLLGTPAWGQTASAEEFEELITQLGSEDLEVRTGAIEALVSLRATPALIGALSDEDSNVRSCAALALGRIGPRAAPAVPALAVALSDEDKNVRFWAASTLDLLGPKAAGAVPALIVMLSDEDERVRGWAAEALRTIGADLKALWWVVPRAYWKQLTGLVLLLATWFVFAGRFPKHRPTSTPKHLALMAVTAAVPVALSCSAVDYAITREWAQGFLPDTLTLVPFDVAALLSTALVVALPAIWVCQRKTLAEEAEAP